MALWRSGMVNLSMVEQRDSFTAPDPHGPGRAAGHGRVLVADGRFDVLEALRLMLEGEDYDVQTVASPSAILSALDAREFDVVVADLDAAGITPGEEGLELLTHIHARDPALPVVVLTAWGSVEMAVEAMRRGARDVIQKPWDNARLLAVIRTQIELGRILRLGRRLDVEGRLRVAGGIDGPSAGEDARVRGDGACRLEDMSLEEVERFLVNKAMTRFDGNVTKVARALGLSRSALYRRLERYGL